MDDILADLLRSNGRIEQKVDDLIERVNHVLPNHERRITKLEKTSTRLLGVITFLSAPALYLYHKYIKKDVA